MEEQKTTLEENKSENVEGQTQVQVEDPLKELQDKYLRLMADFDNLRKRTAREKLDLIQTAGKDVIISLLEVLDDCDRAEKQIQASENKNEAMTGTLLVFSKLRTILQQKGLQTVESIGKDFNTDEHEAITELDVPEASKGKVIDQLNKGYKLNNNIIRHAKVVVGK